MIMIASSRSRSPPPWRRWHRRRRKNGGPRRVAPAKPVRALDEAAQEETVTGTFVRSYEGPFGELTIFETTVQGKTLNLLLGPPAFVKQQKFEVTSGAPRGDWRSRIQGERQPGASGAANQVRETDAHAAAAERRTGVEGTRSGG